MLKIAVESVEYFDEATSKFVEGPGAFELRLEHSLLSLSKWESNWEKPFFSDTERTDAETLDYIRCMSIDGEVSDDALKSLTNSHLEAISKYINKKQTATWFVEPIGGPPKKQDKKVVTSEVIYYWMVSLNIPFEAENWPLGRLLTLIRVCNEKNAEASKDKPKMSRSELAARNRALNAKRKQALKTRG